MINYLALLLFLPINLLGQLCSPVTLSKIENFVWVHKTYKLIGGNIVPPNGMIVQTSAGLILIDAPWDDSLTTKLLNLTKKRFNQDIVLAIITHVHDYRLGGIHTPCEKGIKVVGFSLTCQKAKEYGYEALDQISSTDTTFVAGKEHLELFYPGSGHTIDNCVV